MIHLISPMNIFILILLLVFFSSPVYSKKRECKDHPDIISECFVVEGKLMFWNGNPSARIHLENGRVLGISEGRFYRSDVDNLQEGILKGLNFSSALKGQFEVCPFTENTPKVMRLVCVQSHKDTVLVDRD